MKTSPTSVQYILESLIGPLYLVANETALQGLYWTKQSAPLVAHHEDSKILKKTVKQLTEYFNGTRTLFEIPLDAKGTEFQKKVWKQLSAIPYGEVRSYKEIAIAVQAPKAYRAVGTANGQNPISIIVPCHRVIASDGTLGGFGGGLPTKEKLLSLESSRSIPLRTNIKRILPTA